MVRKSFDIMAGKKPRRTAFVPSSSPSTALTARTWNMSGCAASPGCSRSSFHGESWYDFSSIRQDRRARSFRCRRKKRPQVLFFIADDLAYWVSHDLAERSSYRPSLFVSANDNILVTFPLETTVFLVDVEEMGRLAVEEMFSALGAPESAAPRTLG